MHVILPSSVSNESLEIRDFRIEIDRITLGWY
jgi:hypothetical protein